MDWSVGGGRGDDSGSGEGRNRRNARAIGRGRRGNRELAVNELQFDSASLPSSVSDTPFGSASRRHLHSWAGSVRLGLAQERLCPNDLPMEYDTNMIVRL